MKNNTTEEQGKANFLKKVGYSVYKKIYVGGKQIGAETIVHKTTKKRAKEYIKDAKKLGVKLYMGEVFNLK